MTRRRARAVLRTELPILASKAEAFEEKVKGACALLSESDPTALARLVTIARIYHDGRRMEAQKVTMPDCRKSLEAIANLAARTCEMISRLPDDHRQNLGKIAQENLPVDRPSPLPSEIARALEEVAQSDPSHWMLGAAVEVDSVLDQVKVLTSELGDRCANLSMDAEWSLIVLQEYHPLLPAKPYEAEFLYKLCDGLRKLSWVASQLMKTDRGPRSDTVRMRAVWALKKEFERYGRVATHSFKDKTEYSGRATSPFGRFVYQFFADVEPDDTHRRGLNDAIAFACWNRASPHRHNTQRAERRRSQIIDLLNRAGVTNSLPAG